MNENTTTTDTRTTAAGLTGVRRGAFTGYRWLLLAFLVLGVVQIFLAGLGVFSLDGRQLGGDDETAFDPHRNLGYGLGLLALLILILALIARPGARAIVLSAVLFVLAGLVQSMLAAIGEDTAFVGGLHAFDGMLILATAGFAYASCRRR